MYEYQARVVDVLDGDTILVTIDLGFKLTYSTPVRFFGINAPEVHTTNPHEKQTVSDATVAEQVSLAKAKEDRQKVADKLAEVTMTLLQATDAVEVPAAPSDTPVA